MKYITIFAALLLSGVAGFYSVYGLAQIFHGAFYSLIIFGAGLELAKLTTALLIHKHWAKLDWLQKIYLPAAVFGLMVLTSAGIFGFLAKASQTVSSEIAAVATEVRFIDTRIEEINRQRGVMDAELTKLDDLVAIYTKEADYAKARLGNLTYQRQKEQRDSIAVTKKEINLEELELSRKKTELERQVLAVELEVGPAVYIAEALYGGKDITSVESAIRVVIFMIIFVFDPLAICLLLAAQRVWYSKEPKKVVDEDDEPVYNGWKDIANFLKPSDAGLNYTYGEPVVTTEDTPHGRIEAKRKRFTKKSRTTKLS